MIKEATIYRISGLPSYAVELAEALRTETFHPTAPTQQKASGWEPPRAAHGALVEFVGGQWIARFTTETRTVPKDAVQEKTDEQVRKIEHRDGRKVGKRERGDIAAEALHALLPQAFPRQSSVPVWIDPQAGLLIIGTASASKADAILTSLVRTHSSERGQCTMLLRPLRTKTPPAAAMAMWLTDEDGEALPTEFSIGHECELRGSGEQPPVLRFNRCAIGGAPEVRDYVNRAMAPTRLALDWTGVAAFVLTSTFTLRKIEVADIQPLDQAEDSFDADVTLTTGALAPCIRDLVAALGGEAEEQPL